jgi:large subunit ribosomal protein L18
MADASSKKRIGRTKRHRRIRKRVHGTTARPRLNVFRSLKHIYAQVIDDDKGHTITSASSQEDAATTKKTVAGKASMAKVVGLLIAERAKEKGVAVVSFDRGGYLYHGRVKALADGAREGGLQF